MGSTISTIQNSLDCKARFPMDGIFCNMSSDAFVNRESYLTFDYPT